MTLGRRLTLQVRGEPAAVIYHLVGGTRHEVSVAIDQNQPLYDRWRLTWPPLTDAEIAAIEAACYRDLRERRAAWCERKGRLDTPPSGYVA